MKLFLITFCVFLMAVNGDRKMDTKMEKIFHECLEENDIKESDFKNLENKEDPKMRCIMACIFEKEGFLKNGDIDNDLLKKDLKNDLPEVDLKKASDAVDNCVSGAKDLPDICEKTSFIGVCIQEEFEKLGIKMD